MCYCFTIQNFFFSGLVTHSGVVVIRQIHHRAAQVDNIVMSVWEGTDESRYDLKK